MSDKDLAKAVTETMKLNGLISVDSVDLSGRQAYIKEPEDRKIHERLVAFHKPRSIESEYFRFLKTKIEHHFDTSVKGDQGRIVLVTGATLGSGKTTCALNLALSFARAYGNKTLFIDIDSRRAMSRRYLDLGVQDLKGFSDVLAMREPVGSVLLNTLLFDLIYLPSGEFSDEFIDRLKGKELEKLLAKLRKQFRYIIIDAPPVFPMPEPGILAKHCDGVLVVLGAGKDGPDQLDQTVEALGDTPIIGIVLNGVETPPGQGYGSYGYYGKSSKG
ncbi:MAG: CpsD/CapB family tyrosine-protein kinase [bacterium]|nr:MAG: CpsD/CapB family tyrosine-protein kinase [bacterium]